jgi:hypothetical protein
VAPKVYGADAGEDVDIDMAVDVDGGGGASDAAQLIGCCMVGTEAGRATSRGGCIRPATFRGLGGGVPIPNSTRPAMVLVPTFPMCTQLVRALRGAWRTALGPTAAPTQATILANADLLPTAPGALLAESQSWLSHEQSLHSPLA